MRRFWPCLILCLLLVGPVPCAAAPASWPPVPVARTLDGDTILVVLNAREEPVNLLGVAAPAAPARDKTAEPFEAEASAFTAACLSYRQVYLEFDTPQRDAGGILAAYVWLAPPPDASEASLRERQFNALLLLNGCARTAATPPNGRYAASYLRLEQEARAARRGLWGLADAPPAAAQTPPAEAGITVYVTKTGTAYHRPGCRFLAKSSVPLTLAEAKAKGYTPCGVCKPPG